MKIKNIDNAKSIHHKALEKGITEKEAFKIGKEKYLFKYNSGNEEVAAYYVSKMFGFNLVPQTFLAERNGQIGSCQKLIPDFKEHHFFENEYEEMEDIYRPIEISLAKMFDYLIYATDRHDGNYGRTESSKKLWLVDNAFNFGEKRNGRSFLGFRNWWLNEQHLTKCQIGAIMKIEKKLEVAKKTLSSLLTRDQLSGFVGRAKKLIKHYHNQMKRGAK
jgi:hypothetical protein